MKVAPRAVRDDELVPGDVTWTMVPEVLLSRPEPILGSSFWFCHGPHHCRSANDQVASRKSRRRRSGEQSSGGGRLTIRFTRDVVQSIVWRSDRRP